MPFLLMFGLKEYLNTFIFPVSRCQSRNFRNMQKIVLAILLVLHNNIFSIILVHVGRKYKIKTIEIE